MILIGSMGAGKTTVGRRLAERLGMPFVDIDDLVVAHAGLAVSEIFSIEGETGFRAREKEAVREAIASGPAVIACGGGVVLDPDNVAALRAAGRVVLLDVDAATAADRLKGAGDRPLLIEEDLEGSLSEIYARRKDAYEQAAHVVLDARGTVEATVDAVVGELA